MRFTFLLPLLLTLAPASSARDSLNVARVADYFQTWGKAVAVAGHGDYAYVLTSLPRRGEAFYGLGVIDLAQPEQARTINFALYLSGEPAGRFETENASISVEESALWALTPHSLRAFSLENPENPQALFEYFSDGRFIDMTVTAGAVYVSHTDSENGNEILQFVTEDFYNIYLLGSRQIDVLVEDLVHVGDGLCLATRQGLISLYAPRDSYIGDADELCRIEGNWWRLVAVDETTLYATRKTVRVWSSILTNYIIDASDPGHLDTLCALPTNSSGSTPQWVKCGNKAFYFNSNREGTVYSWEDREETPREPDSEFIREGYGLPLPVGEWNGTLIFSDSEMYGLRGVGADLDRWAFRDTLFAVPWESGTKSLILDNGRLYRIENRSGANQYQPVSSLQIHDVNQPANPQLLGSYPNFNVAMMGIYDGRLFYPNDWQAHYLKVIDPANIVDGGVMHWMPQFDRHTGYFADIYFYHVSDDDYSIYRLVDTSSVELISSFEIDDGYNRTLSILQDEDRACVIITDQNPVWGIERWYKHILVENSDPRNPAVLWETQDDFFGKVTYLEGNRLYVHSRGLEADDVRTDVFTMSNPYTPRRIGAISGFEIEQGYRAGNYLFAFCSYYYNGPIRENGPAVFDMTNPSSPRMTGWYRIGRDLADADIGFSPPYIFVNEGTQVGVYDFSRALAIPTSEKDTPTSFILHPAYPNPFNSLTTITYDIARPGFVRLGVYDTMGRLVGTVKEGFAVPGSYSYAWNADNLSAGGYFLKLQGSGQSTQPIILIK